jgi:Mn2+/Fe2+ NRAMP family transporter
VIRALAKVGLVWAVAVLGALFMTTASQGPHHDGEYSRSPTGAHAHQSLTVTSGDAPRTAGLALALAVLAGGATVLVAGTFRGAAGAVGPPWANDPEFVVDHSLSLDVGLLAA